MLPRADPTAVIDKARPRLLENQCDTMTIAGLNTKPQPTPRPIPCVRKSCQNCVHSAVRKVHVTRTQLAAKNGTLKYPKSNSRPVASDGRHTSAYYQYQ
jgi:hypothetical protein